LVRLRAVVAICWRKLGIEDYSPRTARLYRGTGARA
jgi:hypothetical protein